MSPKRTDTEEHWLARAEEARTLAERMHDLVAIQAMFRLAESYEVLAKDAKRYSEIMESANSQKQKPA
jgi:hypothetical protein